MQKSLVKAASTGMVLAASIIFFSSASVQAVEEQARKADDFVDSLGVVVHVSRGTGVLEDVADNDPDRDNKWPGVRDAICDLGIRTVRTTITKGSWVDRVVDLYNTCRSNPYNSPVKFNFRIDSTARGKKLYSQKRLCLNQKTGKIEAKCKPISEMLVWTIDVGKRVGFDSINSYEGPNEYNSTKNLRCDPDEDDIDKETEKFEDEACNLGAISDKKRCNAAYWPSELAGYMKLLYNYIRGNKSIDQNVIDNYNKNIEDKINSDDIDMIVDKFIVAPSLYLGQDDPDSYMSMTDLTYMEDGACKSKYFGGDTGSNIGDYINRGNLHTYNAGRNPTAGNPGIEGDGLDQRVANAKRMTRYDENGTPKYGQIYVTEYGYRTHGITHVTELAKAKYLPRYAAEFFVRDDVDKVFNYQIVDEQPFVDNPGGAWGLLGNDDNTLFKRPSYFAMRNTIRLLQDPGEDFDPGTLDYDVYGDPEQKVQWFLAQKRNGLYYLVLWQEERSAEPGGVVDVNEGGSYNLEVPPVPVTVAFNTSVASVKTYKPTALHVPEDPDKGTDPICVDDTDPACDLGFYAAPSEIEIPVPDEVVILEIATGSITAANVGNNADFAWTDVGSESGSETIHGINGNIVVDGLKMNIEAVNGTIRTTGQNGFAVEGTGDNENDKKYIEGDEALRYSVDSGVDAVFWQAIARIRTGGNESEEVIATASLAGAEVGSKTLVVEDGPFSEQILIDFGAPFDTLEFSAGPDSGYSLADQTTFVTVKNH
jgi:hypothetical protein